MANISNTEGTLYLVGDWALEDTKLVNEVINSWQWEGEYRLETYGLLDLSPEKLSIKFAATCKWNFRDMLEEIEETNRWWITGPEQTDNPLSAETYDALLEVMHQKNLSIRFQFVDRLEEGGTSWGLGYLFSDGRQLIYAEGKSSAGQKWEKMFQQRAAEQARKQAEEQAVKNQRLAASGIFGKYQGQSGDVVIESSYAKIGKGAFEGCKKLTSVVIPESISDIGTMAFRDCVKLISVTIPKDVTVIKTDTFRGCKGLTSVTIPEGVTRIGDYAFRECESLKSFTIPDGVITIGKYCFYMCKSLKNITIPGSVTKIGIYAFRGCKSLASVTIPEGITKIDDNVFLECRSLKSVTIPRSVTKIGSYAFSECRSLVSVTIPEGVTEIGYSAFCGCKSLASVTVPEGVTEIDKEAFSNCPNLTIHAPAGSAAEQYARDNGIKFETTAK